VVSRIRDKKLLPGRYPRFDRCECSHYRWHTNCLALRVMRFHSGVMALSVVLAGCSSGQIGTPTAPSSVASTPTSAFRIVEDLPASGGSNENPGVTAITSGQITLQAAGGTLSATYPITNALLAQQTSLTDPTVGFVLAPDVVRSHGALLSGTARFADLGAYLYSFRVGANEATITVAFPTQSGAFIASGTGVPSFQLVNDLTCSSGQRLITTVRFQLEYFGTTVVTDSHCIRVP
jgi:hypothetical protein